MRILAIALVLTAVFAADAAASDFDVAFDTIVKGRAKPAIVLTPDTGIKAMVVKLTDDLGKVQRIKIGRFAPNKAKRIGFRHAKGHRSYDAELDVTWANGEKQTFTLDFTATRMGELKLSIKAEDVDLDERTLACRITNPARSIQLKILGQSGDVIEEITETFDEPLAPGEPLEVSWPELKEDILRMDLRITDVAGFWTGIKITPFSIEIPHDEVEFESGRANVRDAEAPKLKRTLGHLNTALAKHGTLLQLKLFVGGYTDTVGGAASNRELSNRRARAIASWFRKNGVKIAIYYQGFGEAALAVQTPDDTEEAKNRRALYILSSHVPTGKDTPGHNWHRL